MARVAGPTGQSERTSGTVVRWLALAAGAAMIVGAGVIVAWRYVVEQPVHPLIDLDVYKRAGRDVLAGRFTYSSGGGELVFTYPPFAALAAVITAPLLQWWGQFLWTLASVAALVGVVWLSFRRAIDRVRSELRPLLFGAVCLLAILTRPFAEHVAMGQINVFLALLCLLDLCATRRRWPQGALIGVAAALKLTPAVFVVYLVVTGRTRAARNAVASFLVCTASALVLLPAASVDYWTKRIFQGERVTGSVAYTSNQSLLGTITRLVPSPWTGAAWLAVALAILVVGFRRARAAYRVGDELGGVAVTAAVGLLISPISWLHHFVWLIPMLGAMVATGQDRVRDAWAALATVVLLLPVGWWGWALLDDDSHLLRVMGVLLHNGLTLLTVLLVLGYRPVSGDDVVGASGPEREPVRVAS